MSQEINSINSSETKRVIHNETPARLTLRGDHDNVLTLAPLEITQPISATALNEFDFGPLVQRNLVRIEEVPFSGRLGTALMGLLGVAFWFVVLGVIFSLFKLSWVRQYWEFGLIAFCLAFLVTIFVVMTTGEKIVQFFKNVLNGIKQSLTVIFILAFGIGMPAATIYFFNDRSELFKSEPYLTPLFLARAMQLVFIIAASLLPGLLYFLFDRQCMFTLRSRFEQSIFRLDPNVSTLTDVRAKYGRQLEEIYGSERLSRSRLNPRGTPLPIVVATILITLGWIIALGPVGTIAFLQAGGLFNPRPTAMAFGFLGAYFFALNDILRRYARRDLKPKAYSSICVRILIVAILGGVITTFPQTVDQKTGGPSSIALGLIFLVGIFPETGLTYIREFVRPFTGKLLRIMEEKGPLTDLDGVDLYDRTRLLDEGVTNVEALAHHDFIDLMIETRIPVPRLVDWVDQSILFLHVRDAEEKAKDEKVEAEKASFGLRTRLRSYGIRTATDLLQVCDLSEAEQLTTVLQTLAGETDTVKVNCLKIIIDTLSDDEWLNCIKHWRVNTSVREITLEAGSKNHTTPADLVLPLRAERFAPHKDTGDILQTSGVARETP
jgi:hypothetical protein